MMRALGIEMDITVSTEKVLAIVRSNRAQHAVIVQEARAGFHQKAVDWLVDKTREVHDWDGGKLPKMSFPHSAPQSHLDVFDSAIKMLEMHAEKSGMIKLSGDAFRHLVENEWEWTEHFLLQNSAYSQTARSMADR